MMKKMLLPLVLVLCLTVLSACGGDNAQRYTPLDGQQNKQTSVPTQNINTTTKAPAVSLPQGDIDFDSGIYDPASEEGLGADLGNTGVVVTPAPTIQSEYAGATPVLLDPIDKPTPTVVPPLSFTYTTYDATKLSLAFDGPAGWVVDNSVEGSYTIYNPNPAMDYAAALTLTATASPTKQDKNALKTVVQNMLSSIGASGFDSFSKSNTAERTLIDAAGIYANYTGVLSDGTKVAGRVHAAWLNNVLYTVHITYPQAYTETYKEGVYDKLRDTIKVTH